MSISISDTLNRSFSVGSSRVDITPPLGTHLAGSGAGQHRPAREIVDPLYASAMVFEAGGRRVCVISLDLTVVMEPWSRQVRDAVAEALDIEPEAVLLCATQTHSAPSMGGFMLCADFPLEGGPEMQYVRGAETDYIEFVVPKAIQAGIEAGRNLKPAELGCGRGLLAGFAFNSRGVLRDRPAAEFPYPHKRRQPLGPPNLCRLEGPMDPEVGVMSIRAEGQIQGLLLHHTCHPIIFYGKNGKDGRANCWYMVSSDWCGAWREQMRARTNSDGVSLVLNGACGDVNPWHPFDPNFEPDHQRMGQALADMTDKILDGIEYVSQGLVDYTSRTIALPYRDVPPQRAAEVERILCENPHPPRLEDDSGVDPKWFRAASTRCVELARQRSATFDYEIQVFRVGDLAIVALPGEPYAAGQLAIKEQSPAKFVQVAHMASQYVGYLPTREAFEHEGHSTNADVTFWSKLAPGCLETVVQTAREMIEQLFTPLANT